MTNISTGQETRVPNDDNLGYAMFKFEGGLKAGE
jgi:hypothetical protein